MEKEFYLTAANSDNKVKEWLKQLEGLKRHNPLKFKPEKSTLLVLDMQNVFLNENSHAFIPSSKIVVHNINRLIKRYKQSNLSIYFTKHTTSNSVENEEKKDMMRKWWKHPIHPDQSESELFQNINVENNSIIEKHQYSAFFNTDLENQLMQDSITQILITGFMTHLCCETTARDAFMRGFEIFFLVDGTATYTEDLHFGTLRSIAHGFGKCISVEDIMNKLNI